MQLASRRPALLRFDLLLVLIATLGSACAFCAHRLPSPAETQPLTVVFSTALVGHLEPCGCSLDQWGGVAHAAAIVDAIRREGHPVLVIDGGDRFFPAATPPDDPMVAAQQRLQADAMLQATKLMKYDAVVLGLRDGWAGAPFFHGSQIHLLDPGTTAQSFTRVTALLNENGLQVGVFSVGSEPDAGELVRARASALRSQGARVVILVAYRTFEEAKALLPIAHDAGVALVLAGRADEPETHDSAQLADATPPLFTVRARGEALLRIDLLAGGPPEAPFVKIAGQGEREAELNALQGRIDVLRKDAIALSPLDPVSKLKTEKLLDLEGRKAKLAAAPPPRFPPGRNAFTYAFVSLSPAMPKDAPTEAVVEEYTRLVSTRNLAYATANPRECPKAKPGNAEYVGDQNCVDCHEEAFAFWKTTPHAHAYESLVKRHKQYDSACIGCHVLGYQQPGGACDIAQTAGRENVQCEGCHGAGSLHSEDEAAKFISVKTTERACRTCHDPENSPHFNDKTYRPQILGVGHGVPVPDRQKKQKRKKGSP